MTAPHYDLDTETLDPLPPSATFTLAGRTWRIKNGDEVALGKLRDEVKVEGEDLHFPIGAFFAEVLVPEDTTEFAKLLEDPTANLTRRHFQRAMQVAFEAVTGFPTSPATGSSAGSKGRKAGSGKAVSSSPVTRARASGE